MLMMMEGQGEGGDNELNICLKNTVVFGDGNINRDIIINEWKDIPMELLLRIVSLLDDDQSVIIVSSVCSGWKNAISRGLSHFSLSWCKYNMNSLVVSLVPKFTNLRMLTLRQDKPQLFDNGVQTVANNCHDLEDLDLSKSFRLSDSSLCALAHGCPNLIKLNISGCSAFSDTALAYLTGFCRKLRILNLCGCVKAASDKALKAIGNNCSQLQSLNLGWCENVGDDGVISLAYGCPNLRALDLCGCVLITDESVIALADNCLYLHSLGLYYCQNITDRAMYALAQSGVKNRHQVLESVKEEGLQRLNISQCTALTPPAVQALCNSCPALHTCAGRHSLIISGCLNLTSVRCACAFQPHRQLNTLPQAY